MTPEEEKELAEALEPHKKRIVNHMNGGHLDSVLAFAHHYAGLDMATDAKITDLTIKGMTLDVTLKDGSTMEKLVPFTRSVSGVKDVRPIVVEMHNEAFNALGFLYKLQHGYYLSMATHALEDVTKSRKAQIVIAVTGVALAGAGLYAISNRKRR